MVCFCFKYMRECRKYFVALYFLHKIADENIQIIDKVYWVQKTTASVYKTGR